MEVAGDKLKNSHISDEALYLTADPAKNEDSEKLVATEVRKGTISCICCIDIVDC